MRGVEESLSRRRAFLDPPIGYWTPSVMTTANKSQQVTLAVMSLYRALRRDLLNRYRPELHYMRGPGPKWCAKHQNPARIASESEIENDRNCSSDRTRQHDLNLGTARNAAARSFRAPMHRLLLRRVRAMQLLDHALVAVMVLLLIWTGFAVGSLFGAPL
jgi:hypothetical protein